MKKRCFAIALALYMVCTILPVSALAVGAGLDNFRKDRVYTQGQYTDVSATNAFSENVKAAYEYNIMQGYGTSFGVGNSITRLASIIVAGRLHSIYYTGVNDIESRYTGTVQEIYLQYAKDNSIFCDFDDVSVSATRAEFAAILSSALPEAAFVAINEVADGAIPDLESGSAYSGDIYRLYRAGILIGSDAKGTFYPDSEITRGAACAIATRMCDESLRKSITLTNGGESGGEIAGGGSGGGNVSGGEIGGDESVDEELLRAVQKTEELVKFYSCVSPREMKEFLIRDYGFSEAAAAYGVEMVQADSYWKTFAVAMAEEFYALAPVEPTKADMEAYLTQDHSFSESIAEYAVSAAVLSRDGENSTDWISLAELEQRGYSAKINTETIVLRSSTGKEYVLTGLPATVRNGDHFFMEVDGVNIWALFYHGSGASSQRTEDNFYFSMRGAVGAGLVEWEE